MKEEKFAYIFRFAFGDDDEIICRGTTTSKLVVKLSEISEKVATLFGKKYDVASVSYGPLKDFLQNESQK